MTFDPQSYLDANTFTPGPQETTAASISRIFKHFSTDALGVGIAIVTSDRGDRSDDPQRNASLNKKARKRLEGLLKSKGLQGWIVTKGGFKERGGDVVYEHSYVVPNVSLEMAVKLAKLLGKGAAINDDPPEKKATKKSSLETDFRQDAILWGSNKAGAYIISYNGRLEKIGTKFEPNTVSPYFTEWRNRRFAFSTAALHVLEYQPTSPSDYRQFRREVVAQCMNIGA